MGAHMKTTMDIADDVLLRAKQCARARNITLRNLVEDALYSELEKQQEPEVLGGMTVVDGHGLTEEFSNASWTEICDASYGSV